MYDQAKTKGELVKELQEVRKERDALKASRGKDIIWSNLAEEALKESEENFRLIFENNSAAMALIEPDTTISMVNEEYCRISGYTKQEVIGMSWTQQIPHQDLERLKEYNRRRLINPKDVPEKYEFTFYHKNGKIMHSMMSITLLSNQKRIASFYDITERKQAEDALRESKAKYQAIFESTGTASLIIDEDTTILMANNECHSNTGYTPAELIGQKWTQYVAPESLQEMMKNYQLRRQNPDLAPKKYEVKLVNKRGEILNAILDIGIISNTKEMVVSIIDITASKKAEEKLRKSEEQYRILFENTGTSLLIVEEDTTISLANEEFARRTGYTRSEIEGVKSWKDIVYREDIDRMFAQHQLRRVSSAAALSSYEFRYRNKAGELHYAIVNAQMVPGTKKSTVSILDITERKRAEDALKESEQKYRNIFENIQNVYYETSMDGTILEISPSIYILSKRLYRREDLLGQNMFKFYTEPERRKILLQELKKTERLEDFDIELKIQDGSLIQCALTCRLIRDENKQPKKIIGTMRNITERKQFEKELIRAKEHAEESDRLKSAFLANMSHEIRTPMNGILGFAELLKEPHLTGEEQQEYINIIEKSGARMLNIINDIVSISKIESGQMKISISATNINEQIQFIYAFFTPEAEKRGLLLSVKNILPSEESIIKTDHEKLYAVLTNLVNNAIKYTHIGSIEFGVKKKGSYLEFFVKDTGVGIHQDQMEIIFERFRQGNDLNTRYIEGAGLGLSISKAYVEMLGGKIWVESELGKGSIFYFTLPYSSESEAKTVSKEVPSGIRTDHQAKDLKILIVEDDESSEMLITFTIKKICKEFLKVGTGVEAVKACRNNPDIDLVLMDIKMPIMDGYEATRQIRQFNKNVVIIAQTAYGLAGDREKAIEAGCNDYISKPIKIDELKGLIQKHFHK